MIRFCDREVCCVREDEADRQQILTYFMNGHRNEMVCMLDDAGCFVGSITYDSLLGNDLESAIIRDCLVLDKDIWENGRECFGKCQKAFAGTAMLPVLNSDYKLVCFAWQDDEANRELRMLDELIENKCALGFKDVFPEYDCVVINGCNELAWYFARYLKEQNVLICTEGGFWKELGVLEDEEALDYRCLAIYSEGLDSKSEKVELRESASVYFECIDKIYEENICEGNVKDADIDFEKLIKALSGKPIGILGTGQMAADAYDLLLEKGIDISCFVSEDGALDVLLGKPVFKRIDAIKNIGEDMIFINANSKYSAWGFGETDLYHCLGYRRNKKYFLLQDYAEIEKKGLFHVIKFIIENSADKIVLFGDPELCVRLNRIFEAKYSDMRGKMQFCDILGIYREKNIKMPQIVAEGLNANSEGLLLLPQYYGCYTDAARKVSYRKALLERYKKAFQRYKITKVTEYSHDNQVLMEADETDGLVIQEEEEIIKADKILLGAIHPFSGNSFFQGILDNHPDIYMINDAYLKCNMFDICLKLAEKGTCDILPAFWEIYDEMSNCDRKGFFEKEKFDRQMEKLLSLKTYFTSQEIFVLLHAAYAAMEGREIKDISEMIIYWEPHIEFADEKEYYAAWLRNAAVSCYIVNVVRNAYIRAGSMFRLAEKIGDFGISLLLNTLRFPTKLEAKTPAEWNRIVMKFEDLKLNPQKELRRFCDESGVEWADALLDVKTSYYGVTGFDLAPVYRTYEEYFSAFDRFRISLITGPWQKKYGYPYVSSMDFSRRELEEMFSKKFRFEEKWVLQNEEAEMCFLKWRQTLINEYLLNVRRDEILQIAGQ